MKKEVTVVIMDLDNTLFDWVSMWYHSFNTMLNRLSTDSGISKDILEKEFKAIFQKYGTSEYSFALQEMPSLVRKHPGQDIPKVYEGAIKAYRKARRKHLKLYPAVLKTLKKIKERGSLMVGYTESMEFYTKSRIKKLGLDGIIDYVYTPQEHGTPAGISLKDMRFYPEEYYKLRFTTLRPTPKGKKKPNPEVLLGIIKDINAPIEKTIYIGDSLVKDVLMAQSASVTDVYAKYGVAHKRKEYELLRKVTHWMPEEVEREKRINERDVHPSYILKKKFRKILRMFDFKPFIKSGNIKKEDIEKYIDIWKKIIDVQQHFNEIELKIRNLAITLLVAVFGASGFVLREQIYITIRGYQESLAVWLLVGGIIGLFAFYLMDRWWYHRLLYGAVEQAISIEERLKDVLPEIILSSTIKKHSPINLFGCQIRSTTKIDLFYLIFSLILVISIILLK